MLLFELLPFFYYYATVIAFDMEANYGIITLNEVLNVFPEIFLAFSLLLLFLHGTLVSSNSSNNYPLIQNSVCNISILILILTLLLTSNIIFSVKNITFNSTIITDILSIYSKKCILIASILLIIIIKSYLTSQKINSFEYCLLILLSVFGLLFLCSSNDLMTAYLCIEIQSLSFYLLAAYKKNSIFSVDAGLKYFILGSFSSAVFLLGASIIYGSTGTLNFIDLKDLFFFSGESVNNLNFLDFKINSGILECTLIDFGLACILVSLFFKLALAPFHVWSPDVYEGSLTSSTIFFAILPKLSLFIFLIRLFNDSLYVFMEGWKSCIIFIGVLSILIGSFVGLEVRKMKTLLAYSSVSHMGYVLLAYSTNCFEGKLTVLSYLIIYIITSVCIWSILIILRAKKIDLKKGNKDLSDFNSLGKSNIALAIFFTVALLSLAGFPPLIGFYVKLKVFLVLMEKSQFLVGAFSILFSAVSTFYYIRLIKILFFEQNLTGNLFYPIKYYESFVVTIGYFSLVYLFLNPNFFFLLCYKMSF